MTSPTAKTQAVLVAAAILPSGKIVKTGDWQNIARPWIRHQSISSAPEHTYEGLLPLTEWIHQVDCFADSESAAEALAAQVIAALDGNHEGVEYSADGQFYTYESDTKVHRVRCDFIVSLV